MEEKSVMYLNKLVLSIYSLGKINSYVKFYRFDSEVFVTLINLKLQLTIAVYSATLGL